VLPIPGFAVMSYASTVEPLRASNILSGHELFRTVHFGLSKEPILSSGGFGITPDALIGEDRKLDYLFVVAGGDPFVFDDRRVTNWLARLSRSGVRLGGVSGGPVVLANAGLMGGRRMTVHWEHASALAEMAPDLLLERSLYVVDRDRVTCAGGMAPMDMMHALISELHGAAFAREVSDWFMHTDIRPPVGPQRGGIIARVGSADPAIIEAVRAMEDHVADPLSLEQLSGMAGVSARQLNRLFHDKLGQSTMRYYSHLRLEKAHNYIRNSTLSLTEIALLTGFSSLSHFSRQFSEFFEKTPTEVRRDRQ